MALALNLLISRMSITSQVTGCDDPPSTAVQSALSLQARKQVTQTALSIPAMLQNLQAQPVEQPLRNPKQALMQGPVQNACPA